MFSRYLSKTFRTVLKPRNMQCGNLSDTGNKKLGDVFFDAEIQQLLRKITDADMEKVFSVRKLGEKMHPPEYKFMTTEQVEEVKKQAEERAEKYLQMPPVIDVREEINEIIDTDPLLDGHDEHHSKMIFTDITPGKTDRSRLIIAREPDGTLRKANWEERHRMNQIYFPKPGKEIKTPKMFQPEHLKDLLDNGEYKFILDRACLQFEPDDPEYHKVTQTTYDRISEEKHFDVLRSTRHFGPLAFYLVINKKMDNLLLENIQTDRIEDAISLVHLYHIVHPDSRSSKATSDYSGIGVLKAFIELDAVRKSILELALQSHMELQKQKKEVQDGIQRAHGH